MKKRKRVFRTLTLLANAVLLSGAFALGSSAAETEEEQQAAVNGTMRESDYELSYTDKEGKETRYFEDFAKWQEFLEENNHWLSGSVHIRLTEEGKQYYTNLEFAKNQQTGVSEASKELTFSEETSIASYDFWCSNQTTNTTTKEQENGMRSCTFGIDKTAPKAKEFSYSQNFYEPAGTAQRKYFGENLIVSGSFYDALSSVAGIEYTTQADLGEEAEWFPAAMITEDKQGSEEAGFELELEQGYYTGIAVRASDNAGNQSTPVEIRNDAGEYVTMIVDKTEPILSLMSISGDEKTYHGEWTNKPLVISAKEDEKQKTLSGIREIEYQYVSIGGAPQFDSWEKLPEDGCLSIAREEDETEVNRNGICYFRAETNAGIVSSEEEWKTNHVRIRLQQTLPQKEEIIERAPVLDKNKKWYNKKTGVPVIEFVYPSYDDGIESMEYGAPVTIHKKLMINNQEEETYVHQTAAKGIPDDEIYKKLCEGGEGEVPSDNLDDLTMTFSYDKKSGYAADGIYHLEYWISDEAGNESEHEEYTYQIDTHEPEDLKVFLEEEALDKDTSETVRYGYFYPSPVSGSAEADFGVSGRGTLKVMMAENVGDWDTNHGWMQGDGFQLSPCTGGCLYLIAEDAAGNSSSLKTLGVIVDNRPPIGGSGGNFIVPMTKTNENDFYHEDVTLLLSSKDMPQGRGSSALSSVTYVIGTKEKGKEQKKEQKKELFSFTKALPDKEELAGAQSISVKEVIDASAFEGNETYIEMTSVDRCGNRAVSRRELKIDVTPPKIEISFDDSKAQNLCYYKSPRMAVITVEELNFDSSKVEITAVRNKETYLPLLSEWQTDGNLHKTAVVFDEDGDYLLEAVCTDLAGNSSEKIQTELFTIDLTAPVAEITYDENEAQHEKYFRRGRTALVTVTEHNFREEDFVISVTPAAVMGEWKHQGDEHSIRIRFEEDGHYYFSCGYTDLAGNEALVTQEQEFYIDSEPPEIVISGVEHDSANAGEVNPVVTVCDTNCDRDHTEITVTTGMGELVPLSIQIWERERGYSYLLTDMSGKEDNIYYLHVTSYDMAGNKSEQECRFSLNRHGSAYDLTNILEVKERYYNRSDDIPDLVITEMNVDAIEQYSIYLTRNGELLPCRETAKRETAEEEGICYSVEKSGDERTGYCNRYLFYKENFEKEGSYRITCYSKDRAGNEGNTTLEEKHAEISFIADNTAPKVVISGIQTGGRYQEEAVTVNLMALDNFGLKEACVILLNQAGEELQTWDYRKLAPKEGDTVSITIPGLEEKQSLIYHAVDRAGNELAASADSKEAITDFLITTNPWLQFISSPGKIAAAVCVLLGVVLAVSGILYKAGRREG